LPWFRSTRQTRYTPNQINQTSSLVALFTPPRLIERFNRTYRTEVLNAYVFESLDQVREMSADWLQSYNEERPHDALAGLPPAMYRAQLEATALSSWQLDKGERCTAAMEA
jgi:putative transposase